MLRYLKGLKFRSSTFLRIQSTYYSKQRRFTGCNRIDYAIEDLKTSYEANSKEVSFLKKQNLLISDKLDGLEKEEN